MFNALNYRCEFRSAFSRGVRRNPWLLSGLLAGNVLHFAVNYTKPIDQLFNTRPIDAPFFRLIGAVARLVLWAEEAQKWIA